MNRFSLQRLFSAVLLFATLGLAATAAAEEQFLEVEDAFKAKAELVGADRLDVSWIIAPKYKLYRERISMEVEGGEAQIVAPVLPPGKRKYDEGMKKEMETYRDRLAITSAITRAAGPFVLKLSYQGCAEAGLCYLPVDARYRVDPAKPGVLTLMGEDETLAAPIAATAAPAPAKNAVPEDEGSLAQKTLQSGSVLKIGAAFLLAGLMLSFTPCVLPMIPILSSIIVGEGSVTRTRGFLLALAYCMGMALVYTSLGVAAGLAGSGLAAALQKPWVLIMFASLLFVLSLSMFDVFQLPSAMQSRLSETSGRFGGGRFVGVFVMGALSALIVGPCVAAPLAGALVYISKTGDVFIGGWALFSMAMGMSVPLLLTGVSAGSLLPKAGGWMNSVKRLFGLLLIGTAIWMVSPILPGWGLMVAVGALAILCAVYLHVFDTVHEHSRQGQTGQRFGKALGLMCLLLGVFELVGAASGGNSVMQPLAHFKGGATAPQLAQQGVVFKRIASVKDLERELATATKPVLLDFYADWCVACKEMEHMTFSDKQVADKMSQFTLLQVDVTANSADDKAIMKKFTLFGPPAIILFNKNGREIENSRVIGYMASAPFLKRLQNNVAPERTTTIAANTMTR